MRRPRPELPPDPASIRDVSLRILGVRAHSVEQLKRKLLRRGFETDAVAGELSRLQSLGLLDDLGWAQQAARVKLRTRYGRRRVERELEAAGIDDQTGRRALDAALEEEDEGARLREALERRLASIVRRHGVEHARSQEGRTKLASHLLQRGYAPTDIIDAVDEALRELAEPSLEADNRRLDPIGDESQP